MSTGRALLLAAAGVCSGCSTMTPLAEYQHVSHATQHFGKDRTNYGYDIVSGGVRIRPSPGMTIDLMEGYVFQRMHGRNEVFTGRLTYEFRGNRNAD